MKKKVALILGIRNERSIAYAVAQRLHQDGVKVAASYIQETKEDVIYWLEKAGIPTDLTAEVDVRNEDQIQSFARTIAQQEGEIHYLFHGVAWASHRVLCTKRPMLDQMAPDYLDIPWEDLQEALSIGAYSLLRSCRAVFPYMPVEGSVLTCTYNASQRVIPQYAGMAMVKACLENLMKYLAYHAAEKNIRVNALSPGMVMTTSSAVINQIRKMRKRSAALSPLGNTSLSHIAQAAAYYLSDQSSGITGNIHYVDGGLNIMGGE